MTEILESDKAYAGPEMVSFLCIRRILLLASLCLLLGKQRARQ